MSLTWTRQYHNPPHSLGLTLDLKFYGAFVAGDSQGSRALEQLEQQTQIEGLAHF